MKIKDGFVVRELAGEYVVVALGEASKVFNGIIKLNDSGLSIWNLLSEGCEREEAIDAMMREYDVSREVIEADFDRFVNILKGANILE